MKKFFSLLLALLMLFALVACEDTATQKDAPQADATEAPAAEEAPAEEEPAVEETTVAEEEAPAEETPTEEEAPAEEEATEEEADAESQATGDLKIVNIGTTNSPSDLNPIDPGDSMSTQLAHILYSTIVSLNNDLVYEPMLAEAVTTEDNKVFTIKLRDAVWTDDEPITADDVIFTIRFLCDPETNSMYTSNWRAVEGFDENGQAPRDQEVGVVKVDDKTVEITVKEAMSMNLFNDNLMNTLAVVPEHIWKDFNPADYQSEAEVLAPTVTSGPLKLVAFKQDEVVEMEANDKFYFGAPKIDKVNFKILQGTDFAVKFQTGELDMNLPMVGQIPASDYEIVKGLDNVTTSSGFPATVQLLFMNNKLLSDNKIRQAISHAINRDLIVEQVLKGQGEAVDSFFTSFNPYRDPAYENATYDPELAKKLIEESDFDPATEIVFNCPTGNPTREQVAEVIAENLKDVGLNVVIEKLDFPTTMSKAGEQDYGLTIMADTLVPTNPTYDLPFFLTTGNFNAYSSEEVDRIVNAIMAETDDDKIKQLCYELQANVQEDVPMTVLYASLDLFVKSNRIVNAEVTDYGMFNHVEEWDIEE